MYGSRWSAFEIGDGTSTIAVEATFYQSIDLQNDVLCAGVTDGGALAGHIVQTGDTFTTIGGIFDWDSFVGRLVLSPSNTTQYAYAPTGDHDGG
jgi:hypothetical protein